jgi:hypothetical protein
MTGTTYNTTHKTRFALSKGAHQHFYCWLFSYNMGLTNLEYKSIQQDLTDEKERLQGHAGLREIKVSL